MTRLFLNQKYVAVLFLLAMYLIPFSAFAQSSQNFSRQGIFGCNRNNAALSGSVGAFSATGGVYVPVADYTVELNTGTLVYQQCVLRGIVNRESESVNAAQIQRVVQFVTTGNNGNPMFQVDAQVEIKQTSDEKALPVLTQFKNASDATSRETNGRLAQSLARGYVADQRPITQSMCPYNVDLRRCRSYEDTSIACEKAMTDTRCTPFWAYYERRDILYDEIAAALEERKNCLDWGRGFYCKDTLDENGNRIIETPSSVVQELNNQALTSGFRRIENANDIDQMVGALYAGIGNQALASTGGLRSGLTTAIGNQPSYLSQLTAESSAGLRSAATNAALQVLAGARQIETQYNNVITAMANTLTSTIGQLRSIESQCWNLIAYNTSALHVCSAAPTSNTCTNAAGTTIRIATSTVFSQQVIDAQISPLANQVVQNVQKSQQALTLIDQLIAGVTNTSSANAQRLALVQLDQLVSQGKLHVQADVTAIQQQRTAVTDSMSTLVDSTKTLWADNATLNVATGSGWCNVQRQPVIDHWDQQWR